MISSRQIKAARALLSWKGAIKTCLEEAGIIFSGDPLTDPGVKLRKSD
jgi:hypothetical protein